MSSVVENTEYFSITTPYDTRICNVGSLKSLGPESKVSKFMAQAMWLLALWNGQKLYVGNSWLTDNWVRCVLGSDLGLLSDDNLTHPGPRSLLRCPLVAPQSDWQLQPRDRGWRWPSRDFLRARTQCHVRTTNKVSNWANRTKQIFAKQIIH